MTGDDLKQFEAMLLARSKEIVHLAQATPATAVVAALQAALDAGETALRSLQALKVGFQIESCELERIAAFLHNLSDSPGPTIEVHG